jgi:hypothetical protein
MMQLSSSVEQRRHTRINTALLVQYRFDLIEGYRTEYVTDISEGGLFVRTDRPHEAGAYVQLQLTPRNCATIIEGLGLVVRVTRSEENTVGTAAGRPRRAPRSPRRTSTSGSPSSLRRTRRSTRSSAAIWERSSSRAAGT